MTLISTLRTLLLLPLLGTAPLAAQVYYSKPLRTQPAVGLLESKLFGEWYRGSGVVVRDPRLIFSCAHLFYDGGIWANDYLFYRNHHRKAYPKPSEGLTPRGVRYFTSYASNASRFGSDSNQAFMADFTVLYGYSGFGTPAGWHQNGASVLTSAASKRIVGYPAVIDFTGAPGDCFQHSTDLFNRSAYQVRGAFYEFNNVSTGPGNSGGPIFVRDETSGQNLVAGMLVSGSRRTAGVVALNEATHALASDALGIRSKTLVFSRREALVLPDGSRSFTIQSIPISGFSGNVEAIRLSLTLMTSNRGDLDVYLQSPNGRIRWIARRSGSSADHLVIRDLNLNASFKGGVANGVWRLFLRDSVPGNPTSFKNVSLSVTARE